MNAIVRQARQGVLKVGKLIGDAQRHVSERTTDAFADDALPFLDPVDQITEATPPRFMRSTLFIIAGMFLTILAVSAIVKIDLVVIGHGTLITKEPPIVLQAFDRAIIRSLPVNAGDEVTKGQILATLDPTFAQADLSSLTTQQGGLKASIARTEAELADKPFDPGANPTPDEQLQATLYREHMTQFKSHLNALDEEIGVLDANIRTADDDRTSLEKELAVMREVEGMRSALLQSQNGSKLSFLDAQALRMRTERNVQDAVNRLKELQHSLQSKKSERESYIQSWRHDLTESLVAARTQSEQVDQGLSKAALVKNLVVLTAPADGVVLDVAHKSVGSVMGAGEQLVTIAPKDSPLVADIVINSGDIGYIHSGEEAVVKVDAFPYQRHGYLHGNLKFVSEESFPNPGFDPVVGSRSGGAVHRGKVSLDSTTLRNLPPGAGLIPGMTLSAEIKVGSRRAITFFIYPLISGLGESLREP